MSELYWIGRVGALDAALIVLIIVALVLFGFAGVIYFASLDDLEDDVHIIAIKYAKKTFIAFVSLLFIEVFIPSTKELYIIYGVGGTIDYIKQDSVGNQLPHKVIEACDKFLEQELKEDNEE